MALSPHELRVLGALIEKEITTPDAYPLSLNSLQAAANQRSSRDPVLDLTEDDLRQALHGLEDRALASPARGSVGSAASRVSKYEHHARTVLSLRRDETALLCLLLLRGPQTPGDPRSRADRRFQFDALAAVVATLDRLAARPAAADLAAELSGPLTAVLPRLPGAREARYTHLLGDPATGVSHPALASASPGSSSNHNQQLLRLEERLAAVEQRVAALEAAQTKNTEV